MSASEPPRMRIAGVHHVTLISSALERTTAFYRDLLGMALLDRGVSDDDPDARHFWFGDENGGGTRLSFLEYPDLAPGSVGPGCTHHIALAVSSPAELDAWREHLHARGVECTAPFARGGLRSIYFRDPDGHILELTTPADASGT